jgi:23S rRNA (cytosine1962-C5)-methyltransferase
VALGAIQAHVGRCAFHRLLDSGNGYRLEQFGEVSVARPDPHALWSPRLPRADWEAATAWFHREQRFGTSHWERRAPLPQPWLVRHGDLAFELALTPFKHTGIFPEHEPSWSWLQEGLRAWRERHPGRAPRVLNLFAYTGAASLAAAAAGAEVCHVDAAREVVAWARRNQAHSGLGEAALRWITDDAGDFLRRELKRGRRYDGILLDPPAYGRDPKGQVFRFETHVGPLLADCRRLLGDEADFLLVHAYSLGYSATVIGQLLAAHLPEDGIELGELRLDEEARPGLPSRQLPCSVFARWSARSGR